MLARRFASGVLLLALGVTGPASAGTNDDNVTVDFRLSILVDVGTVVYYPSPSFSCQLSVATGADGFDVLDAAVAQRCILSYSANGSKLECVDGVCDRRVRECINLECTNWITAIAEWSSPLLGAFRASSGSWFAARYESSCC